jgi:predicted membrane-bound spermidine synthase
MMSTANVEVSISSVTQGEWWSLAWGFFWRGVCFGVASGLVGGVIGGILGAIVGLITAMVGGSIEDIRGPLGVGGFLLGLGIGFYLFRYYIRWVLRARFGSLRLVLVRASSPNASAI